ncbi:MAG: hypothetical protein EVG15_09795 [Candidatus Acididesulfobacter diazotrophicus]|jgi:predicted nuclease of predicted toxin-antitoxin system|uniref:DUF5615 domain-containing protein n=1 Tax=Candidatus Acididesulfobacter diazotrophicus TaxID=2597226 RepID=A0A519BKB9_9DELT|nr:MAG: hypothetical protein EVG15_09795 [Candidatus Acididesulfobacter diazotrophicus]
MVKPGEKLKFLIDVGVGKKVENFLSAEGYDTKCIRDINPRMADIEILNIAATENRMVVTMDKDFGELVYNSKLSHGGVLLLRLEEANSSRKLEIVKDIIKNFPDKILNKFCVYKDGKLRIRG